MKRSAMPSRKAPMRRSGFTRATYGPKLENVPAEMQRAIDVATKELERLIAQNSRAVNSRSVHSMMTEPGRRTLIASAVRSIPALFRPMPKDNPIRSEAYRRLVAAMPCAICGIQGYSQAAHGDFGKGLGIKSTDLSCFPACGPHDGRTGCHYQIGTAGIMTKEERRLLEAQCAESTQAKLIDQAKHDKVMALVLRAVGLID